MGSEAMKLAMVTLCMHGIWRNVAGCDDTVYIWDLEECGWL